jgi:hypothetical protein
MKCNRCEDKTKLIFQVGEGKESELICSQCLYEYLPKKIKKGLQEANNLI